MNCKNCNSQLSEDFNRFCSNCGERINANRLTVKSIVSLFFSNFLSYDNKFIKTFRDLTLRPEKVINSYNQGFRRNYVNVVSYLGLVVTLIGLQFYIFRSFFPELLSVGDLIKTTTPVNEKIFDPETFLDNFYQYQGLLTVMFIPIYAFGSKLLFLDSKRYNLAEHFVINIYTNAHFFTFWFVASMISIVFSINYNLFSQFAIIPMLIYMTYVFKRLFDIKTFNAFIRVVAYYLIALIVMIISAIIIGVIYGIYLGASGQIQPIDLH
ncbi:DUF3667 domain-containing protein [Psychroserpens luteolus]|uniref:DUF3667 domain-containing protein n=1 Tax=Psychroserpens luteolus TaxID=2855840 RepID=UPI001E544E54|nr:DUF3667 domain-containing protein [Psychroserpens luteolus]MCD2260370.1 DUF3667 domain-containing protein [Psychroserpens luteolus]